MLRIIAMGLLIVLSCAEISGCIYRPDIQQGNVITDVDLKGLHVGMNNDEVRSLFGDPVLVNLYDARRVIYVYTFKHRRQKMQSTRLVIYFRSGRVSQFWTNHLPIPATAT